MKITALSIREFMRIAHADFTFPANGVTTIGAKNGGGKTSFVTCLRAAFGGKAKLPPMPVKKGAKKSVNKITLDDDGRCVTIEDEIGTDGEIKATVRQDGGPAFPGPMAMLKALTTTWSFDPFPLMQLRGREQRDTMLTCLGVDFADLEGKAEDIKKEREIVGRDKKGRERQIESMQEFAGVPSREISMSDAVAELQKAMKHNDRVGQFAEAVDEWQGEVDSCLESIADLEKKLAHFRQELKRLQTSLADTSAQAARLKAVDLAPLQAKINDLEDTNRKVRANAARAALVDQFGRDHEKYRELDDALKDIDRQKQERLAAAKAPVDGLEFRDDGVYFQGLPLSQDAGSGQMVRAVELVAALNPKLKTIVIDDGERILAPRLAELDAWAIKAGYQVFVLVATESKECTFTIEEGCVKA
jgi:DNA repair ATPase RecN